MGEDDYLKPLIDYLGVTNQESERGKVLVAVAQIDAMLEAVLKSFCVEGDATTKLFDGPNAPFSSLFNKANAAKALGLISEDEWSTINVLRKIRNEFAHSVHMSMKDPKISTLVKKLSFGLGILVERDDPVLDNESARFGMCTSSVISSLYNRAHYVALQRRPETVWPK
jgi:hypothetical protein